MGMGRNSCANWEHEGREEGAARMRAGEEEWRRGNGGTEILGWGKKRGERAG